MDSPCFLQKITKKFEKFSEKLKEKRKNIRKIITSPCFLAKITTKIEKSPPVLIHRLIREATRAVEQVFSRLALVCGS